MINQQNLEAYIALIRQLKRNFYKIVEVVSKNILKSTYHSSPQQKYHHGFVVIYVSNGWGISNSSYGSVLSVFYMTLFCGFILSSSLLGEIGDLTDYGSSIEETNKLGINNIVCFNAN